MFTLVAICLLLQPPRMQPVCPDGNCPFVQAPIVIAQPVVVPKPPIVQPKVDPLPIDAQFYFGVDQGKRPERDRYMFGDREVSAAQAHFFFDAESPLALPDDAAKPHLTLVAGDDAGRKRLESILTDAAFGPVRERYRIQVYDHSACVDQEMVSPFKLSERPEFSKSGTAVILQKQAPNGSAKVDAIGFSLGSALDLLAWLRRNDDGLRLPSIPSSPASNPDAFKLAFSVLAGIGFGAVAIAVFVIATTPPPRKKG